MPLNTLLLIQQYSQYSINIILIFNCKLVNSNFFFISEFEEPNNDNEFVGRTGKFLI